MTDDGKATCIQCGIPGWKHQMCPWQTEAGLKYAHPECNEKVSFTDLDGANPKLAGIRNDDRH